MNESGWGMNFFKTITRTNQMLGNKYEFGHLLTRNHKRTYEREQKPKGLV